MRLSSLIKTILRSIVVIMVFILPADAADFDFNALADPMYRVPLRPFPECCAEPEWWASVDSKEIRSIEDLYALWQGKVGTNREKAKAFFQSIHDFRGRNDEIVAAAIALYPNVDRNYPDLIPLLEYGVGTYFDYDGSHDHYVGPAGDRSAGLVRHLARQYQGDGLHEKTVKLLAAFMARREAETNPHLKQLISMLLAQSLDELGEIRTADRVLANALTYDGSWDKKISDQRNKLRQKLSVFHRMPANTGYYLLAAILLLAAVATFVVRRRHGGP